MSTEGIQGSGVSSEENLWRVAIGDPTHVTVPGLLKPINCFSRERAQFVVDAVNARAVPTISHANRIAEVLRLARCTLNAKGGPLASERRDATNAIARLLNDMGECL